MLDYSTDSLLNYKGALHKASMNSKMMISGGDMHEAVSSVIGKSTQISSTRHVTNYDKDSFKPYRAERDSTGHLLSNLP